MARAAVALAAFDPPGPIATEEVPEALAPVNPTGADPIAIAFAPVAEGASVAETPEPIAIGPKAVPALAKSPIATDCAVVAVGTVAPPSFTPPITREAPPPVPSCVCEVPPAPVGTNNPPAVQEI
jgi:hypothetical protein